MSREKLSPVHPDEVLMEEFLKPMGLSRNRLALNIGGRCGYLTGNAMTKPMQVREDSRPYGGSS